MKDKASKVRDWLRQLVDKTVQHWVSYGSMSQCKEGKLLSVAQHKQGILLVLDTGTAVWRCRSSFARTILRCLNRRRELRAKMARLHLYCSEAVTIDGANRMTFATVGGDVEQLFASEQDVAEYQRQCRQAGKRRARGSRSLRRVFDGV